MNEMYKKRYDTMFENESKTEQDCAINVFYLLDLGNLVEIIRTIVLFIIQYCLDLRKISGEAKKFLKSRSFLFQTLQNH